MSYPVEKDVEGRGPGASLQAFEQLAVAIRGHAGDPDKVPLAVRDPRLGQLGLKGRGNAFGDAHGLLDRPGRAAEKPGGEVGEAGPLRSGVHLVSTGFPAGAEGGRPTVSAMRGLRIFPFMATFPLQQRLGLLQGSQPAEALGKVRRIGKRKSVGHWPCL